MTSVRESTSFICVLMCVSCLLLRPLVCFIILFEIFRTMYSIFSSFCLNAVFIDDLHVMCVCLSNSTIHLAAGICASRGRRRSNGFSQHVRVR